MRYVSARISWTIFALAVLLLVYLGVAADQASRRFAESAQWVSHTREVETNLERIEADLLAAESGRLGFIVSQSAQHRERYQKAIEDIPAELSNLRRLTRDNPQQQQRLERLTPLLDRSGELLEESLALRKSGTTDRERQDQITRLGIEQSSEVMALLGEMKKQEAQLLEQRSRLSEQSYRHSRAILAVAFLAVLVLLFANFWQLLIELRDRKRAEASVRRLSGRILQLQDAERRKVARELHDSIGQYFAGLKMSLDMLRANNLDAEQKSRLIAQSLELLDQGMAETRTLSHLLHPPLLDEVGFASAASWFVDGFSQRSKIAVKLEVPEGMQRLPRDLELALFRVLQEGLTNVHRHSGSASALVTVDAKGGRATLAIRDYGKGISQALLQEFRKTSGGTGVGLAGMRERVVELGGELNVDCDGKGTCLRVTVPLPNESLAAGGDSGPEMKQQLLDGKPDGPSTGTTGLMLAQA